MFKKITNNLLIMLSVSYSLYRLVFMKDKKHHNNKVLDGFIENALRRIKKDIWDIFLVSFITKGP